MTTDLLDRLDLALSARADLFDDAHESAFRLFNGFTEGAQDFAIDVYARTVVIHDYRKAKTTVLEIMEFILHRLPWLRAVIHKIRTDADDRHANGTLIFGTTPDHKVRENGIWYSIDLQMNRDCSLYLDTRNLRMWARENLCDKRVLNTFAYTCSIGVAAQAGGAARVVNSDLNERFLSVGRSSYTLNHFAFRKSTFRAEDFWRHLSQLNRDQQRFDCVFLDPPFFSATAKGVVHVDQNYVRLVNKVRPVVEHDGVIVAVNNGLFVSGSEYLTQLESICADGYVSIEKLVSVGDDFAGYPTTKMGTPICDPSPFNHSTKIAVLRVRRKNGSRRL